MTETSWPWPSGAATGIGSLPGTDIAEAQRVVLGELPELPYLPELPARGPGADLIGRTAGLLVELPVELYAGQWRVAARPGRELRRARDLMERDLDQLAEQAEGYTGPVKIQAAGPWTLAAALDLPIGGRLLRDPGAVRDLTGSLAEGLRAHVTEVRRRLPGATVLLQLDEPSLPAVLAGTGADRERARGVPGGQDRDGTGRAADRDRRGRDAGAGALLRGGRAAGADPDRRRRRGRARPDAAARPGPARRGHRRRARRLRRRRPDLGAAAGGRAPTSAQVADRVRQVWDRLGFPRAQLARQVVVTPACGLAGASSEYVRAVFAACREAARRLAED